MDCAEAPGALRIVVAFSRAPREVDVVELSLPLGATVIDALRASGLLERHPEIDPGASKIGVWGTLRPLDHLLRDHDRVEVYRPLRVDPKEARRQRHRRQRGAAKKPA